MAYQNLKNTHRYIEKTPMLDFQHPSISKLINIRGWGELPKHDAIGEIYAFVRDEIKFGYNEDDQISASQVLKDGYGQCNTKGTLLMALLRAIGVENRVHGFTIYNELQKGAIPNFLFGLAPKRIIHSWVEICLDGRWINLEGYIIDKEYLSKVQRKFLHQSKGFSGYGVATDDLQNPAIDWVGKNTYIQSNGIADDYGLFDKPDDFYNKFGSNLTGFKKWLYEHLLRHLINANVRKIRKNGF